MEKLTVLAAGSGMAAVLVVAGLCWKDLAIQFYLRKLRQETGDFLEALQMPGQYFKRLAMVAVAFCPDSNRFSTNY